MSIRWGIVGLLVLSCSFSTANAEENIPPAGFRALFNGRDLQGWHGIDAKDTRLIAALSPEKRAEAFQQSQADIHQHWSVEGPDLVNDGQGLFLTTDEDFGDFELLLKYRTVARADSGIFLKGNPQVQIWDWTEEEKFKLGSDKGSGGLWNNAPGHPGKDPLVLADKPLGEWNSFRIRQIGARTTVFLNGKLVVDHALLDNYFVNKKKDEPKPGKTIDPIEPLIAKGPIQLQTHGGEIRWKDIFIREIPAAEANGILSNDGFTPLFDGKSLAGWAGAVNDYEVVDQAIRCKAGKGGVLHTKDEYADFVVRIEFKLPPAGNNGLAIRYPGEGDTAYVGMCELQILDNDAEKHRSLDPRQYHGSVYGIVPAARGYLRQVGEWNYEEVTVKGSVIKVELNGNVILDEDVSKFTEYLDGKPHPGKDRTQGYFGFAGHNEPVEFRNIRIKELSSVR